MVARYLGGGDIIIAFAFLMGHLDAFRTEILENWRSALVAHTSRIFWSSQIKVRLRLA